MRGRELYRRYHRLIDDLAQSAEAGSDWWAELSAQIERFEADASALDSASARILREELCEQLEHEALHSTRDLVREVLIAALKQLELGG